LGEVRKLNQKFCVWDCDPSMRLVGIAFLSTAAAQTVCHAIVTTVTDAWCQLNCHASPPFCPPTDCVCSPPTPAPPTPPPPAPSPPTPAPPPTPSQGYGQLFTAYYSGIGEPDLPKGAVNSLSLAFFAPDRLAEPGCTFTNTSTCLQPAAGAGSSVGQKWAIEIIRNAAPILSKNTSPRRGGKPSFFFSFGGLSEGGAAWDTIFGSAEKAATFGTNAAKLVQTINSITGGVAHIGIDLDIEGATSSLPEFGSFLAAFRAGAAYDEHPLMLCTLSGLMFWDNDDHYKLGLLEKHGPAAKGVNFVNFMVDNIATSCEDMSSFWRNETVAFLPPSSRVLGRPPPPLPPIFSLSFQRLITNPKHWPIAPMLHRYLGHQQCRLDHQGPRLHNRIFTAVRVDEIKRRRVWGVAVVDGRPVSGEPRDQPGAGVK